MVEKKSDVLFWLEIMKDHAEFHISTLAPKEKNFIENATYFMKFFKTMIEKVQEEENWNKYIPEIYNTLNMFIDYKRSIVRGLLTCKLEINLPPTFINHQINEASEFNYLLTKPESYYEISQMPLIFMNFLKNWIADASGHAAGCASDLDSTETLFINEALSFKNSFDMLNIKAQELHMMMMQTGAGSGPDKFLADQLSDLLKSFIVYLKKLRKLRSDCLVLATGTFKPLLPDHMIREHEYVLGKIKEYMDSAK